MRTIQFATRPAKFVLIGGAIILVTLVLSPMRPAAQAAQTNAAQAKAAQATETDAAPSPGQAGVPGQIQFSGVLPGAASIAATGSSGAAGQTSAGAAASAGTQGVTFALYAEQTGGTALWMETQNVTVDAAGSYSVLLGAVTPGGLPQELFSSREARWLEVSVANTDGTVTARPRVLLVSVPYALKAGDAETLGGLPASAFALSADALAARVGQAGGLTDAVSGASAGDSLPTAAVTTQDQIPLFVDGAGALSDSIVSQKSGKIGIGTTTPGYLLSFGTQNDQRIALFELPGGGNMYGIGYNSTLGSTDVYANGAVAVSFINGIGMQISTAVPKAATADQDVARFSSSDLSNPLQLVYQVNSHATASLRHVTIQSVEQGVIARDLALNPYGGNVGIGTTTPSQRLHVVGGILSTGTVTATGINIPTGAGAGKVLTSDGSGSGTWQTGGGGSGVGGSGTTNFLPKFTAASTVGNSQVFDNGTNVGIGTASPSLHLSLGGDSGRTFGMERNSVADTAGNSLTIQAAGAASGATNKDGGALVLSAGVATGTGLSRIMFRTVRSVVFPAPPPTSDQVLETSMIITGRQVGIGTETPFDTLDVNGNIRVGSIGSPNGCVKDRIGSSIAGSCSSDARLKKNIVAFAPSLDKVAQLRPVHFDWRADEFPERHFGTARSFGLIAQEVENVLPELVVEDEQGYKAVNYSKLPLFAIQAIRELKEENDALREDNEEMKARLARLESLIEQRVGVEVSKVE